jgi:hypothetical protein
MADSNREIQNIEKLQQEEQKLLALQKERLKEKKKLHHMQEKKLERLQAEIKLAKANNDEIKKANKEYESSVKSFNKLTKGVKEQLSGASKGAGTYLSLSRQIANQKAVEARYLEDTTEQGEEQRKQAQSRLSLLEEINSDLLNQAKATQATEDTLKGISSLDKQIEEFKAAGTHLDEEQLSLGIEALKQKDALEKKQNRLNQIQEEQQSIMEALPGPIKDMVSGAQKFGKALINGAAPMVLLAGLAIAALASFTALDSAAGKFRETTGLTNSQMEGIKFQANDITSQFAYAGVNAEKVLDTVASLKSEFSDVANFGNEVVAGLTLLNTNFGVAADKAAKVQGIFEQVGGLSSETAASVQLQVANMANLAGVAPAKIFEDIAENAEIASTLFQGDVESLAQAAIEARRLGTNLKSVASTTEHLLDFQGNIGDELTAATFVGGQFNLTQARSLAAAGKTVEAQKEVLKQLQRSGDFRKQDYFTQQQLAKAAGMSVEEINKQLNAQEKLNSLSSEQRALADKAIEQGLDISNIDKDQLASQVQQFSKQQEMQASVEKLTNAFTGIAAAIGSAIVPALDGVMEVINPIAQVVGSIVSFFAQIPGFFPAIIAGLTTMYILQKRAAIQAFFAAIPKIFSSFASIPFGLGIPLAVGAVAGLASMMSKKPKVADDMYSPPGYGSRVLTGPEGSIALNNNDTVLAGTNLGGGGDNGKMDALIAAVKETKDVYMDGRRVTGRVGRVVDNSAKNNFAFG